MTRLTTAVALAVMVAAPALADTTLTVGKASPNADPIMPVNVGVEAGIFKKHGLDIKIVDFNGGGKDVQAMVAGAIDIGDGAGTEMAFVAKGAPMLAICEDTGTYPFLAIGVPADGSVKTVADLKGKKMGISGAGSLTEWLTKELARTQGWAPDDITTVAIGNSAPNVVSAFRGHLVDADITATSLFLQMEDEKTGRVLAPVSSYEGSVVSGALYASNHLIETNPAAIKAFIAGWLDTIAYIKTHKAETVKIEAAITGFSESVMSREYDLVLDMFSTDCRFDTKSLATLSRSFSDLKLVTTPPDMSKLYTEKFLP